MIKKKRNYNAGFTYVELIVVLSIFSTMTSIVLFNYNKFQEKVDIKVLANDIAMKIVEAQKSALSGLLPPLAQQTQVDSTWKPSYGIYLYPSGGTDTDGIIFNKKIIYFSDLGIWDSLNNRNTQNSLYDITSCPGTGECLDKIIITKGSHIYRIDSYLGSTPTQMNYPLSITFKRPESTAFFNANGSMLTGFDYIQITVSSPDNSIKSYIKVYPSGRIQIN